MFNYQILDVAIGLVFIYFFLGLVCSVLNEVWASLIKKRSKMLEEAISSLLKDGQTLERLYQQPLFLGTFPKGSFINFWISLLPFASLKPKSPSYISSRSFVLSLLESLKRDPKVVRNILQEKIPLPEDAAKLKEFEIRLTNLPADNYPYIKKALTEVLKSAGNDAAKACAALKTWYGQTLEQPEALEKIFQDLKAQKKIPGLDSLENIHKLVAYLPEGNEVKKALIPLLESVGKVGADLDKGLAALEKWYDEAMERVSGWYKRYSQTFTLIVAFVVALGLNADTFAISKALYLDQAMRTSLAGLAETAVKQPSQAPDTADPQKTPGSKPGKAQPPAAAPDPAKPGPQEARSGAGANEPGKSETQQKIDRINSYYNEINKINVPLGWGRWWNQWEGELKSQTIIDDQGSIVDKAKFLGFWLGSLGLQFFLGIFVTALLVSLGSNFWFELLNKLINLRNAGKKPLTAQEEAAKKAQAGG